MLTHPPSPVAIVIEKTLLPSTICSHAICFYRSGLRGARQHRHRSDHSRAIPEPRADHPRGIREARQPTRSCGLPESLYPTRFVKEGQLDSDYPIVVGGTKFRLRQFARTRAHRHGFGQAAKSSWRKVSRASFSATASPPANFIPAKCTDRLCDIFKTGDVVTVDLDAATVTVKGHRQGLSISSRSAMCGPSWMPAACSISARKSGMIAASSEILAPPSSFH